MSAGRIHVGTSGWHYGHWVGPFYPEGLASDARLAHYAQTFAAVELNNSFYQLPDAASLEAWCDATQPGFLFACKASRYITHMKKLKDPDASTPKFFAAVDALGAKLGPILFQLPPRWRAAPERLDAFLAALPAGHRYAFEFRDASWWSEEVEAILRAHGAAFCAFDLEGRQSPLPVTADFVYLRLHGPDGAYQGSYDDAALERWAAWLGGRRDEGRDVFCFFDNDEAGYAPADAARLQAMLASVDA